MDWVVCFGTHGNVLISFAALIQVYSLPADNRIIPARNSVCICLPQVAGMVSVIWMIGIYLIAFAPWLHIPVYVGPLVMYGLLLCVLCLPLPVLHYRSRLWLLKTFGQWRTRSIPSPVLQWNSVTYVILCCAVDFHASVIWWH